ncbi:MAG TPA: YceI family protein [Micromonosporaceae bacterium]|nr:YceI family protein [Micromonosporaceae bacterium]
MSRTYAGLTIPDPGTFVIDPAHTLVGAVARHLMVSKVRGRFADVSGVIKVAEDPLQSSVEVTIKAASIDTGVADRDNHLRSADFLDVENHPELTFRSTRIAKQEENEFWVVGDLTIRGVTREIELPMVYEGLQVNPWGKEVIGFSGSTELDREEFGMTWNAALESGGVLVGKKLKIELEVEATREE